MVFKTLSQKTKHLATRTRKISSSTSGTCRITLATNPVISHVIETNWHIYIRGQLCHKYTVAINKVSVAISTYHLGTLVSVFFLPYHLRWSCWNAATYIWKVHISFIFKVSFLLTISRHKFNHKFRTMKFH
jgi:hypothetical protein